MRWISSEFPCSRNSICELRPVRRSLAEGGYPNFGNRSPDECHWWREGLGESNDGNSNWRQILTHAYNLYYNHWTAGQRNDFQVATLAAYWHQDTDRHDEASLDRAVGTAVHAAVKLLMGSAKTPVAAPSAPVVSEGRGGHEEGGIVLLSVGQTQAQKEVTKIDKGKGARGSDDGPIIDLDPVRFDYGLPEPKPQNDMITIMPHPGHVPGNGRSDGGGVSGEGGGFGGGVGG
jgi:hypothetical protein